MIMLYYTIGGFGFVYGPTHAGFHAEFYLNPSDCQWIIPGTVDPKD